MQNFRTLALGILLGIVIVIPLRAVSQGLRGVTGISLQALPNAISLQWKSPTGVQVDHFTIYYAKSSILENNGRYDGKQETPTTESSFILSNVSQRGFAAGDMLFATVTYTDRNGTENRQFAEEKSIQVIVPPGPPSEAHAAADGFRLQNAVAVSATMVKLQFSSPPGTQASLQRSYTITDEETKQTVFVAAAQIQGSEVTLTTLPMSARRRYEVKVDPAVADATAAPIDPEGSTAVFVARGLDEETPPASNPPVSQPPSSTPPSSSPPTPSLPPASQAPAIPPASSMPPVVTLPVQPTTPVIPPASAQPSTSSSSAPASVPPVQTPTINLPPQQPVTLPVPDTTPPENPTDITLKRILQPNKLYTVEVSWKASINSAKDLNLQNLYESKNLGITYVGPTALDAIVTSAKLTDVPPGTLTVKITAADKTGNESAGEEKTIVLPETGASVIGLSALGASAFSYVRRRRKARKE